MRLFRLAALAATMLCAWSTLSAGAIVNPVEPPEWRVSEWINGNPGTLGSQEGRVVVVHFFQLWCPGCNNFTVPLMQRWDQLWGDRDDFMIVSIHTVFEGHDYQTPDRLRDFVRENGIRHPVGIDDYDKRHPEVPVTMRDFRNTGTPQVAVIDKEGLLIFNHFGSFEPATVEFMIERMLKEKSDRKPPKKPVYGFDDQRSGRYKIEFTQTSKTCGKLRDPFSSNMTLEIFLDRMTATFSTRMMGVESLEARYDPRSASFEAAVSQVSRIGSADVESAVSIQGNFVKGARPPQLEYDATFTRRGGNPGTDCDIQARGTAQRIGD
jgi:thiol-disulfide isomerase/thioredoxin